MGKIFIDHGIEYEEWTDGLVVRGFVNVDDKRTKLVIPRYLDSDAAPDIRPPFRSVIRIDNNAFQGESYLQSVEIPETIISIGEEAFNSCVNLKEVITYGRRQNNTELSETSLHLFKSAFKNCSKLEKVFLNRKKTYISADAFAGCSCLKTFGGQIFALKRGAFDNCNLDSLTFADWVDISNGSIENSGVKELFFKGTHYEINKKLYDWLKKSQVAIHCEKHAPLVDFAYEGINISIVEKA